MNTVTTVGYQARNRKLAVLGGVLLTLGLACGSLAPPAAEAGGGKARKLYMKNCKSQAKACVKAFQDGFTAEKAACKAKETGKDRKQCKKAAKKAFKTDKRRCSTALKKACKPCCKTTGVTSGCNVVVCGDGFVRGQEQCEDGNTADADGCSSTCLLECGNGIVDAGEECESDSDCAGNDRCTRCTCSPQCESENDCPASYACVEGVCTPPLGRRTFSLGHDSAFKSSFLGSELSLATPTGTIELEAGAPDENGVATVTTVGGPFVVRFDVSFGAWTVCNRINSCTGQIYCNGGANVDVLVELNSVQGSTVKDDAACEKTGDCDAAACCANACEGLNVGSGNNSVNSIGINPEDSGPGALVLTCDQQSQEFSELGFECPGELNAPLLPMVYTTGTSTARVVNHCAGGPSTADIVPEFAEYGQNFNCSTWTTENSDGALTFSIPTEEPTSFVPGDGANAGVFDD